MKRKGEGETGLIFALLFSAALIVVLLLFGWPVYSVWRHGKIGEAELCRAVQSKQIAIEQAKAELESAKLRAQAIAIEGEAATKYPAYRTQQFIGAFADAMREGQISKIVYVPTEAGIPILEAK